MTNPEYLFTFTHIFSKQSVSFLPTDISLHKNRYDEFYFIEGTGVGEIHFPYEGQYLYEISEQPMGSGNLNPALAVNVVENGEAQIIVQSAITVDSQFDTWISPDEYNSNVIFAPDEPNPTANITPTPTPTYNPVSPTPTPSVTSTNTPTPSVTQTGTPTGTPTPTPTRVNFDPASLGALWWVDFTNANNLVLVNSGNNISQAKDLISGNYIFQTNAVNPADATIWSSGGTYPYSATTGVASPNAPGGSNLSNLASVYGSMSAYTIFANFALNGNGGGYVVSSDNGQDYSGGTQGYRWFSYNNQGSSINRQRIYTFYQGGASVSPEPDHNIGQNNWVFGAVRVYMSNPNNATVELFFDGVLESFTTNVETILSVNNPIFNLLGGGTNSILNTEISFFDRKLTTTEMTYMWNYLSAKYPNQ